MDSRVLILCLASLWIFGMLPWAWHNFFFFFFPVCLKIWFPAMPGSSEGSADHLCDLCHGLHSTLAEADMLGRRCKKRSRILRTLFRLIDLDSARLNLHIANLCLAVSLLCLCVCVVVSMSVAKSPSKVCRARNLNTKVLWTFFFFFLAFFSPAACQWKQPAQHL